MATLIIRENVRDKEFKKCGGIDTVIITEEVTSIASGAFTDCPDLEEVYMADTVTEIGDGAFAGCKNFVK